MKVVFVISIICDLNFVKGNSSFATLQTGLSLSLLISQSLVKFYKKI